jgi:hypothetical protein
MTLEWFSSSALIADSIPRSGRSFAGSCEARLVTDTQVPKINMVVHNNRLLIAILFFDCV